MKKFKVAIIGSRSYTNKEEMWAYLDTKIDLIEMIISGNAKGADQLGQSFGIERGIPILIYPAKWYDNKGNYDRGAGFRRNNLIIKACDYILCWWDGVSTGSKNSIDWAKKLNKPIKIFKFTPPPLITKEKRKPKEIIQCCDESNDCDDPVDWAHNV